MASSASTASPYRMHISPDNTGSLPVKQTNEAAQKASDLLQEDLENHHVYFNDDGFHNHVSHHILALYGTGADAESLQHGYNCNAHYQRPVFPVNEKVVEDLQKNWDNATHYFGFKNERHYPDFLLFFQRELEARGGWEPVLTEYLFKGDAKADDMLIRLYAAFLHPLIQLMYGMEWNQPAIVAEALAQTCVHDTTLKEYMLETERLSKEQQQQQQGPMPPIVSLFEEIKQNEKLATAAHSSDKKKVDGLLSRARDEMIALAARVRVSPDEVEEKTVEMYNACVYMASSAAIHPTKIPRFDFFLMHHVNSSPIFPVINAQSWIPAETKARLLEWKIRLDLLQYAARAVPTLSRDMIAAYEPEPKQGIAADDPMAIISKLHSYEEDGHIIKLARATRVGQVLTEKYVESKKGNSEKNNIRLEVQGSDLWNKIYHLIVDSTRGPEPHSVRSAGFEEAWKDVPTRG